MDSKLNVYFLGSGKIAVPVLEKLLQSSDINMCGIGTQLDRPAGRNRHLQPTPIGEYAEEHNLAIDKIENVNAEDFLKHLKKLNPDMVLVVSFGQLLKQDFLNLPPCGCVNIHASLLPRFRGASPIVAAIASRDNYTGVCFMKMERGLDTGGVFRRLVYPLNMSEYCSDLELALGKYAGDYVVETLLGIRSGLYVEVPQSRDGVSMTGKIRKEHGKINFNEPAALIEAKIRAFYPWPGAWFKLALPENKEYVITIIEARIMPEVSGVPGEILQADKKAVIIACGEGALELRMLLPQGKKSMSAAAFVNGCRMSSGFVDMN